MFCPRCGRQAAEEVSFCAGCGLPLDAAAELVEAGGRPDWALARAEEAAALTPRQRGVRKGLMITLGGLLFSLVVGLLTAFKEDFFVFLILAGLILVVGVMRMLYGLLLEEHAPERKRPAKREALAGAEASAELSRGPARGGELPHARTVPASLYAKPADTSDMTARPSVTENTTKLLDDR